jgi:hypothetical protein
MKWRITSIAKDRGDFLPIVMGVVLLLMSLPAIVMVLWKPDRNSGVVGVPLLIVLGLGVIAGLTFVVMGIRLCSTPGTHLYRLSHGRIFSR